jgi:hypothetical protein
MFRPLLLSPKALVIEKAAVASLLQLVTTISPMARGQARNDAPRAWRL